MMDGFSMQDAMRLAGTPAGQQLLDKLQQCDSSLLQQAMTQASSGNYAGVQAIMQLLMNDPDTARLIQSMRRERNE